MTQPKKPKSRSIIAIALAVLLSLIIAVIIYFTVFNGQPATVSVDSELNGERSLSTSIVKENQLTPTDSLLASNNSKDISVPSYEPQDKKTVKSSSVVKQAANSRTNPTINSTKTRIKTVDSSQQNPPAYKLKQTEAYQQLDADIDKDNEQLAELINEVKNRNQSQIQQHQLPQSDTSDTKTTPQVEYDYPITPITPLPTTDDSKPAIGSTETER